MRRNIFKEGIKNKSKQTREFNNGIGQRKSIVLKQKLVVV